MPRLSASWRKSIKSITLHCIQFQNLAEDKCAILLTGAVKFEPRSLKLKKYSESFFRQAAGFDGEPATGRFPLTQ